jgi:phytoene/squalene synthetase
MPVGRFVLDVHGEPTSVWPASDKLCAALQVINHLQDCKKDYQELDRVYIPQDSLDRAGVSLDALRSDRATPALETVTRSLAERTAVLLSEAKPFSGQIDDFRLALEVSVIQRLAENLVHRLMHRDPLSQRVHHRPLEAFALAGVAAAGFLVHRPATRNARPNFVSSQS